MQSHFIRCVLFWLWISGSLCSAAINWRELDDALKSSTSNSIDIEAITSERTIAACIMAKQTNIVLEMLLQKDRPRIVLAGFFALQKIASNYAYAAAMHLIVASDRPTVGLTPYYSYVQNHIDQSQFNTAFNSVCWPISRSANGFSMLVKQIDYENLWNWFNDASRFTSTASVEAEILVKLYSQAKLYSRKPTPRMADSIFSFRGFPGKPGYVYLLFSNESGKEYKDAFENALQDDGLEEIMLADLIEQKRAFMHARLKLDRLRISATRMEIIGKYFKASE